MLGKLLLRLYVSREVCFIMFYYYISRSNSTKCPTAPFLHKN